MKIPVKLRWRAALLIIVTVVLIRTSTVFPADTLPSQISDAEFWRFVTEFSEPNGPYPYENYVGNEVMLQRVIPAARKEIKPGGVYIGVGPEQNFTYALALEAKMAFVLDIRRQNMLELLLYKALFEMTDNRADFVAQLFSRKRPPNLDAKTNVTALFDAYRAVQPDEKYQQETIKTIKSVLAKHGFTLSKEDLQTIERVHAVFYRAGPSIDYTFEATQLPPRPAAGFPSFERMMIATDGDCGSPCLTSYSLPPAPGRNWSFLRDGGKLSVRPIHAAQESFHSFGRRLCGSRHDTQDRTVLERAFRVGQRILRFQRGVLSGRQTTAGLLCQRPHTADGFIERVFAFHQRDRKRDAVVESTYREYLRRVADFGFASGCPAGSPIAFISGPVKPAKRSIRAVRRPGELTNFRLFSATQLNEHDCVGIGCDRSLAYKFGNFSEAGGRHRRRTIVRKRKNSWREFCCWVWIRRLSIFRTLHCLRV